MVASQAVGRKPGPTCSVCDHARRGTIDRLLAEGRTSSRAVAGRFGLSKSAMDRHRAGCVPAALVAVATDEDRAAFSTVLDQLRELHASTLGIFEAVEGDSELALKACKEARANLELIAKLTRELAPDAPQVAVQVNVGVAVAPAWLPPGGRATVEVLALVADEPGALAGPRDALAAARRLVARAEAECEAAGLGVGGGEGGE